MGHVEGSVTIHPPPAPDRHGANQTKGNMLQAIKSWLAANGRKGGKASNPAKGFGSPAVRAKAAATCKANRLAIREATRAAERADMEREIMRQAVVRATKGRKA